jgi:hypothetical protein
MPPYRRIDEWIRSYCLWSSVRRVDAKTLRGPRKRLRPVIGNVDRGFASSSNQGGNSRSGTWATRKVLTEQRWRAYRSLFQKTGLSGGIDRSPDYPGATFFIASHSGIGIKGYVYSEVPLSPLVASLDGKLPPEVGPTKHGLFAFKPIKPNSTWYLYYYTTMNDGRATNLLRLCSAKVP